MRTRAATPSVRSRRWLAGPALLFIAGVASARTTAAPHVAVEFAGIDAPHADAIAATLSEARQAYVDLFGFDMPDTVTAHVICGPDQTTRLYTDGKDSVFLSLKSIDELAPPTQSGVFNLYGLCHEVGHMAMYRLLANRGWMTDAGAEGWAHWAGSVVVDRVYEKKGEKLWVPPYDYRQDGTARLERMLKASKPSDVDRAAGTWKALDAILGHEALPTLFRTWQEASVDPAHAVEALGKRLQAAWPAKAAALDGWWKTAAPLIATDRAMSAFARTSVDLKELSREPILLADDDGGAEDKRSMAGSGHARSFEVPTEGDVYLTAVRVFGARYGAAGIPKTTFEVSLCDAEMHPIASWTQPYSAFDRGEMAWTRLAIPPTRVPKTFQICVAFAPTATNGVYVGIDQGSHGRSRTTLPGELGKVLETGDWMIRAEIRQTKTADPLKK